VASKGFLKGVTSGEDHLLFLAFTVLGILIALALRLALDLSASIAAISLSSLVFLYGVIVYRTERFQVRPDIIADNLYFLGFIFTMVALAISLFRFSGESAALSINTVIGDLGVGLATTITGLIGRNIFHNMRSSIDDLEADVRVSLKESAEAASEGITSAASIVEDSRVLTRQILDETNQTLQASREAIENALGSLEVRISKVVERPEFLAERLLEPVEGFRQELDKARGHASTFRLPMDALEEQLRLELRGYFNSAKSQSGAAFDLIAKAVAQQAVTETEKAGLEVQTLVGNLEVPEDLLTDGIGGLQELQAKLSVYTKETTEAISSYQTLLESINDSLKAHHQRTTEVSDKAIDRFGRELAEASAVFSSHVSTAEGSLLETTDTLATAARSIERAASKFDEIVDQLSSLASDVSASTEKIAQPDPSPEDGQPPRPDFSLR